MDAEERREGASRKRRRRSDSFESASLASSSVGSGWDEVEALATSAAADAATARRDEETRERLAQMATEHVEAVENKAKSRFEAFLRASSPTEAALAATTSSTTNGASSDPATPLTDANRASIVKMPLEAIAALKQNISGASSLEEAPAEGGTGPSPEGVRSQAEQRFRSFMSSAAVVDAVVAAQQLRLQQQEQAAAAPAATDASLEDARTKSLADVNTKATNAEERFRSFMSGSASTPHGSSTTLAATSAASAARVSSDAEARYARFTAQPVGLVPLSTGDHHEQPRVHDGDGDADADAEQQQQQAAAASTSSSLHTRESSSTSLILA